MTFKREEFKKELGVILSFYDGIEALLAEKTAPPKVDVFYENISDPEKISKEIKGLIEAAGIPLNTGLLTEKNVRRQDKRQMASEKISNPDEMLSVLEQLELRQANDGTCVVTKTEFSKALGRMTQAITP